MRSSFALSNMFTRHPEPVDTVRPGSRFRREHPGNMVEVAEIVSVSNDDAGIPHVCFNLCYQHPARGNLDTARRTLALKSFSERYRA